MQLILLEIILTYKINQLTSKVKIRENNEAHLTCTMQMIYVGMIGISDMTIVNIQCMSKCKITIQHTCSNFCVNQQ